MGQDDSRQYDVSQIGISLVRVEAFVDLADRFNATLDMLDDTFERTFLALDSLAERVEALEEVATTPPSVTTPQDTRMPEGMTTWVVYYPIGEETITVDAPDAAAAVRAAEPILRLREQYYGPRLEYIFGEPEVERFDPSSVTDGVGY